MKRCFAIALILAPMFAQTYGQTPSDIGPFGIGSCHINNRSAKDNQRWIPQMKSIGLRYYRSPQTGWQAVQPGPGQWKWDALDQQMDYLDQQGFSYGGILIGNPKWTSEKNGGGLPVGDIDGWSRYVSATVGHCKGRIKRWEVWNEPPNFTAKDQTPADYAKIVVSAYKAAKTADPDCLVGLAAKSAHINYLEQVIKAGAKDHFDFITLHPYEVMHGIVKNLDSEPLFLHILPTLRKMLAAQNPSKANVPVIFTELGVNVKEGADTQAHALIKAYTLSIAQGVQCVQWFEGRDGDSGPLGLLDREGNPRPAYTALGQMIKHLGQHPKYVGWMLFNGKHPGFVFETESTNVLVTWGRNESQDQLLLDDERTIIDPLTGKSTRSKSPNLTVAPVIILDVPAKIVAKANANAMVPMPWGGDYEHAKSVSITMGSNPNENGLHSLASDIVADAVVGYGGSARFGGVPGGNLFVVDPEFLSYTSEPIEITVVVRRNEANDNSGFKLVYESTDGFKSRGWYTVPDNKTWHTKTWQIDDAQFNSYWGYNFSLVSDGNVYNKYYVKSVTVTKR